MTVYNRTFNEQDWQATNIINRGILDDFIMEYRANEKKESTLKQYYNDGRIILIYILKKCNNRSILELKKKDFRNFTLWLIEEQGVSSSRSNRLMSCCRSILNFCEDDDDYDYDQNFAAKQKGRPNVPVRDICFLTNDEIMKIIDYLIENEEYQKATLVSLFYDSAGRKNEIAQVTKESFLDPKNNCTNMVIGKRGKKFKLVYFSKTKECAKLWLEQRGEDSIDSLWCLRNAKNHDVKKESSGDNIYNWIIGLRDLHVELGGTPMDFNPHSIRHSSLEAFSTNTHYVCKELGMTEGFPLEELKLIAHHNSIETTQSYLKDKSSEKLSEMFGGIVFD